MAKTILEKSIEIKAPATKGWDAALLTVKELAER